MKTPDDKPLFTLTAEEVEIVRDSLRIDLFYYARDKRDFETVQKINNILTRIKQWQDGNK